MTNLNRIIEAQLLASLSTLKQCLNNSSDEHWNKTDSQGTYSQVIFHALFYLDYYLCDEQNLFKEQDFHKQNRHIFKDYEELIAKAPENIYTKADIEKYFDFCFGKIKQQTALMSLEKLAQTSSHRGLTYTELFIYNIRHLQHHAAALGIRIEQHGGKSLQWVGTGWKI